LTFRELSEKDLMTVFLYRSLSLVHEAGHIVEKEAVPHREQVIRELASIEASIRRVLQLTGDP
jgi:hypothetical protein